MISGYGTVRTTFCSGAPERGTSAERRYRTAGADPGCRLPAQRRRVTRVAQKCATCLREEVSAKAGREMTEYASRPYFSDVATLLKVLVRLVPTVVTAVMITTAMRAAIRPYSMAVA